MAAYEMGMIKGNFTKEINNAWFLKKKSKYIETTRCFVSDLGYMPVGLWADLLAYCKQANIPCEYSVAFIEYLNQINMLKYDDFKAWVNDMFNGAVNEEGKPFAPYEYQIEAAYAILRYKNSSAEISTSAGKTLISFIIFKYTLEHNAGRCLYIVPSVDLATQSADKFLKYESYLQKHPVKWTPGVLKAGLRKAEKEVVDTCDILFGTFQSLANKEPEFFEPFKTLVGDECVTPDTMIRMADDTDMRIDEVQVGDIVMTYNEETHIIEPKEVEYVYKNLSKHDTLIKIEFESGDVIRLTPNHKVLTVNRGYVRADKLETGDQLVTERHRDIKSITAEEYHGDVYNLRIKSSTELNHNYFANGFCVSNCHHISAVSIRNIISNCKNLEYKVGVTGTYQKATSIDNLNMKSYYGPHVYTLTADALINKEKSATPIYIVFQILEWATDDEKKMLWDARNVKSLGAANIDYSVGSKLLRQEQKFVNASFKRMKYIADMAAKMKNNTLLLFGDVKNGYGRRIYEYLKNFSDKQVYYIDGGTPTEEREYYKKQCEEDLSGNTVLVASIGTFGEGIDIANLGSIFLVNSAKSERIIRQICGRGLRKCPGKDKTVLYDFVDNMRYSETGKYYDNYMWTHYKERKKVYKEQNFPCFEQTVKIP